MKKVKNTKEYSNRVKLEETCLGYEAEIEKNAKNEEIKRFAKTFNKLLEKKEYSSCSSFAKDAHISPASVSNYRRGITMPSNDILNVISTFLDVSVNHLLGIDECKNVTAQQVHNMLGLNEYAMEHLYSLKHNIEEVKEMDSNEPSSDAFKTQLETLNLLIADKRNLIYVLNSVKRYIDKKREFLKVKETTDENDFFGNQNVDDLLREVLRAKTELEQYLYTSLDYITEKLLKEKE